MPVQVSGGKFVNGGGDQKTERFPVSQQNPVVAHRSQGLIPFAWGAMAVAVAVAASLYAVSHVGGGQKSEAPTTTVVERTVIREVTVPTRAKEAIQVEVIPSSVGSELPSLETPSSAPTSTPSTTSESSSTAALPSTSSSSEPKVVTVEQAPVETTTVDVPATQAEQP